MKVCHHCHGTSFECIDGNYFCENCNTQLPFIYEQYSDDVGFSQIIPSSSKDIADKYFDKGHPWTFHEAFLTLLLKQCNQLVNTGVPSDFKTVVFNLFKVFLSKQNIAFTSNPQPGPSPHLRDIALCIQNLDLQTTKKFLHQLKKSNANPLLCDNINSLNPSPVQKEEFNPQVEANNVIISDNQTNYDLLFKDIIMEYEANTQSDSIKLNENKVVTNSQQGLSNDFQLQSVFINEYCTSFIDEIDPTLIDFVLKNKNYKFKKKIDNLVLTQRQALVHNICFIYLGLLFIKFPKYQLSHLLRLIKEHKLAYFGSSDNLPSHMKFMLYDNQILIHKSIPLTKLIRTSCFQLCNIMDFTTKIPKPHLPSMISTYADMLHLPGEFTRVALAIYAETQNVFPPDGAYLRFEDPPYNKVKVSRLIPNFEGRTLSYLYVALKLAYHSHFTQNNLMPPTSDGCFATWWQGWISKTEENNLYDLASLTLVSPQEAFYYMSPNPTQTLSCPCHNNRLSLESQQSETDVIIPPSGVPAISTRLYCPTPQLYTAFYARHLLSTYRLMSSQNSLTTISTKYVSGRPAFKARLSSAFERLVPSASDSTLEYNPNRGNLEKEYLAKPIASEAIVTGAKPESLLRYSPCFVIGSAFDILLGLHLANKESHDRLPNVKYLSRKRPFKIAFQQFIENYIKEKRGAEVTNSSPYFTILFEMMANLSEQSLDELMYEICVVEKKLLSTKFVTNTIANS